MEQIRQAVERAKASGDATPESPSRVAPPQNSMASPPGARAPIRPRQQSEPVSNRADLNPRIKVSDLNRLNLEGHRVISHNATDPRSKSFDMLRTQVLQSMDQRKWQILAVTSPTPGCGKTVTAINLALSIARQPERSALLVDMDLQRPQIANCLGVKCQQGLLGVLEGRTALLDAMIQARIDSYEFMVLPAEAATIRSSELIASRAMNTMLQDIKRDFGSWTVILDMPPMLSSDDVIALLPQIDCVLLVAAVGISTQHEITECNRHLQSAEVVRYVLNKAHEKSARYYY